MGSTYWILCDMAGSSTEELSKVCFALKAAEDGAELEELSFLYPPKVQDFVISLFWAFYLSVLITFEPWGLRQLLGTGLWWSTRLFILKKQENKELSLNTSLGFEGNIRYYWVGGERCKRWAWACSGECLRQAWKRFHFHSRTGIPWEARKEQDWGREAGTFWKVHCKSFYHSYYFSEENYFWLLVSGFWLQGKILPRAMTSGKL